MRDLQIACSPLAQYISSSSDAHALLWTFFYFIKKNKKNCENEDIVCGSRNKVSPPDNTDDV